MKKEVEVKQKYNVRVKVYKDSRIEIIKYDSDNLRHLEDGYEKIEDFKRKDEFKDLLHDVDCSVDRTVRSDSIYRSKTKLIDYALANREIWKSFITLTFADNVTDLSEAHKVFNIWCTQIRRIYPDFKYLGVPEFQKRGAVHYHILTNIDCGSKILPKNKDPLITWNPKHKKNYSTYYYDIKYWSVGYSTAFDILRETDTDFRLEKYLIKYMFCDKNCNVNIDSRLWGRHKILHSKGLDLPDVYYYDLNDDEFKNLIKLYDCRGYEKKELISNKKFIPSRSVYTIE